MEWNEDSLWWEDGVKVQVHGNRSKGAAEALLPPGKLATVPAGPALHRQASHRSSTPSSPASSYNQGIRYSKKYSTDPPGPRKQPWFEFLPLQATVKPMLRPRKPYSPKNQQSIDKQAAQEQRVAAARSARYMQQAAQLVSHNHHHSLQLGPAGAEPELNIVQGDKGRHKPEWARTSQLFDPITSTSRPLTAPGRTYSRAGVLSPNKGASILQGAAAAAAAADAQDDGGDEGTCSQRNSSAAKDSSSSSGGHETLFFAGSLYHTYKGEIISLARGRPGSASPGRYNPLTHTWTEPPSDAGVYEKWQRDGETAVKTLSGRRPLSAGPRERRDASTSRSASAETVAGLMRQHSSFSSSGPTDDRRPASAGGRRHVLAMNTWGTYDVIRNEWVVPPADARYVNSEASPFGRRAETLTGSGGVAPVRRTILPPNQGVYNPINGEWKVLPQQPRATATLDFAPRKLFQEKAFVKR